MMNNVFVMSYVMLGYIFLRFFFSILKLYATIYEKCRSFYVILYNVKYGELVSYSNFSSEIMYIKSIIDLLQCFNLHFCCIYL